MVLIFPFLHCLFLFLSLMMFLFPLILSLRSCVLSTRAIWISKGVKLLLTTLLFHHLLMALSSLQPQLNLNLLDLEALLRPLHVTLEAFLLSLVLLSFVLLSLCSEILVEINLTLFLIDLLLLFSNIILLHHLLIMDNHHEVVSSMMMMMIERAKEGVEFAFMLL